MPNEDVRAVGGWTWLTTDGMGAGYATFGPRTLPSPEPGLGRFAHRGRPDGALVLSLRDTRPSPGPRRDEQRREGPEPDHDRADRDGRLEAGDVAAGEP